MTRSGGTGSVLPIKGEAERIRSRLADLLAPVPIRPATTTVNASLAHTLRAGERLEFGPLAESRRQPPKAAGR